MIKYHVQRISFVIKAAAFIIALVTSLFLIIKKLGLFLSEKILLLYGIDIDYRDIFSTFQYQESVVILGVLFVFMMIFFIDILFFSRRVNHAIKDALSEHKFKEEFNHLYSSKSFHGSIQNLNKTFSFLKTIDTMKTAKASLESNSIKPLTNNVSEGVVFLNKYKVVLHINHIAELFLGLIPGEAEGEVLSRKFNNDSLDKLIDKTIEFDQKIINEKLDDEDLVVNIIPIKDKFGDVIRVMIIFIKEQETLKSKEPDIKKES